MWLASVVWFIASSQTVAVKNNLLYDGTLTPNLCVDIRLHKHWSVGASVGYRPWPTDDNKLKKWKHLLVSVPSVRYWSDSTFYKRFYGAELMYCHYNVSHLKFPFGMYKSVRDRRMQGDLYAVGVSAGRSWWWGRHFRFEVELGMYFGFTRFREYDCQHCGTYYGRFTRPVYLPKACLTIAWTPSRPKESEVLPIDTILPPPPPPLEFVPLFNKVADNTGRAGALQKSHAVLEHISNYRPYDNTRILRKEEGMLYVHFKLDKWDMLRDYRDNGPILDQIVDITRQIMDDTTSMVKCIQIIGLASVEGTVAHNQELSDNRARSLKQYIQAHVARVPDSLFELVGGCEAWSELRDQVSDELAALAAGNGKPGITAAQLQAIIDVIDSEPNLDARERKIRRLDRGRTYTWLRDNVLSDQRNSGYLRIYYDYVPDVAAATINHASELLSQERYDEALAELLTVAGDLRAQNALGVALYMTGERKRAIACFERAAANGNPDAQSNLDQLHAGAQ